MLVKFAPFRGLFLRCAYSHVSLHRRLTVGSLSELDANSTAKVLKIIDIRK